MFTKKPAARFVWHPAAHLQMNNILHLLLGSYKKIKNMMIDSKNQ